MQALALLLEPCPRRSFCIKLHAEPASLSSVIEKFYGSLSDEQKKRFNRLPPRQA
jgi:hypothetical protein